MDVVKITHRIKTVFWCLDETMATERKEREKDNFKETKQKPGSELTDNKGRTCQNLFLTYRRLQTHET